MVVLLMVSSEASSVQSHLVTSFVGKPLPCRRETECRDWLNLHIISYILHPWTLNWCVPKNKRPCDGSEIFFDFGIVGFIIKVVPADLVVPIP